MFSNRIPSNNYRPIKPTKVGKLKEPKRMRNVLDEDAEELTKERNRKNSPDKEDGKGGILDIKL